MTTDQDQESLDVLACDFRARPRGAPTVFDVLPAVRRIERTADTLIVDFDSASTEIVTGYVAAERLCCRDIRWVLDRAPALQLRITATPAQLDILEQLFHES